MPLYKMAIRPATGWGTASTPGAGHAVPFLSEDFREEPEYAETREEMDSTVHDRGEVKQVIRTFRGFKGSPRFPIFYSAMHPMLLAAFGANSETVVDAGVPVTRRRYGTASQSPQMYHTFAIDRRSSVWKIDSAIARSIRLSADMGQQVIAAMDVLPRDLDDGAADVPSSWTFEGGQAALDKAVMHTSAQADFRIAAFSTSVALNSGNSKSLRAFEAEVRYVILGGKNTEYEGDRADEPAWSDVRASGSFEFSRYDADLVTWAQAQTRLMAILTYTGAIKGNGLPYVFRIYFPRLYLALDAAVKGAGMIKPRVTWKGAFGVSATADIGAGFPTGQEGRSSLIVETDI